MNPTASDSTTSTDVANRIKNVAAYKFAPLDCLTERRVEWKNAAERLGLRGTILLSSEGINLFLAGKSAAIDEFLERLRQLPQLADLEVKESFSREIPFRRLLVKIKREIITFNIDGIAPAQTTSPKLPAKELKKWLDEGRPVTLLDVRNDYEVRLGAFDGALPIGVDHFRQFPQRVHELPESLKNRPLVMYCTGGIRCEKAGPYMESAGFRQVYQLEGGILKYFEECGGDHFRGDCFVFDQRVAVDSQLEETDTAMCFACQAPLTMAEQASPLYVVGESCPHCYRAPEQTLQETISRRHAVLAALIDPLPGCTPYENRRPIKVPAKAEGRPLLDWLVEVYPRIESQQWEEVIEAGRLQYEGKPLTATTTLKGGQRLENVLPETVEPPVNAQIQILYEDDMIVVINKPAPLPMHPCGRFNRNTVISLLNQVYAPQRLRVAHRLDANTTGVVVFSRTRTIAGQLQPQFEQGNVQKTYLVKVHGTPHEDVFACDAPVSQTSRHVGSRFVDSSGRESRTEFRLLSKNDDGTSFLEARPITGRTNQIRLHAAHLGLPVVGDPMYGVDDEEDWIQTLPLDAPPLRLHAWRIAFPHPQDGKTVEFIAPPPSWFHGDPPR